MSKEIHEAVTIATRYAELHEQAKIAISALSSVRYNLFSSVRTDKELSILMQAGDILLKIRDKTGFYEAIDYINSLKATVDTKESEIPIHLQNDKTK